MHTSVRFTFYVYWSFFDLLSIRTWIGMAGRPRSRTFGVDCGSVEEASEWVREGPWTSFIDRYSRLLNRAAGPEIIHLGGLSGTLYRKTHWKGWGPKTPTFSSGLSGRRWPFGDVHSVMSQGLLGFRTRTPQGPQNIAAQTRAAPDTAPAPGIGPNMPAGATWVVAKLWDHKNIRFCIVLPGSR